MPGFPIHMETRSTIKTIFELDPELALAETDDLTRTDMGATTDSDMMHGTPQAARSESGFKLEQLAHQIAMVKPMTAFLHTPHFIVDQNMNRKR